MPTQRDRHLWCLLCCLFSVVSLLVSLFWCLSTSEQMLLYRLFVQLGRLMRNRPSNMRLSNATLLCDSHMRLSYATPAYARIVHLCELHCDHLWLASEDARKRERAGMYTQRRMRAKMLSQANRLAMCVGDPTTVIPPVRPMMTASIHFAREYETCTWGSSWAEVELNRTKLNDEDDETIDFWFYLSTPTERSDAGVWCWSLVLQNNVRSALRSTDIQTKGTETP